MGQIILIINNVRSAHNVGSLLRTADGLGVKKVIISGYSPYPLSNNDSRLPHLAQKAHRQIQKTALGAEETASWSHSADIKTTISELKKSGYKIIALEQTSRAVLLDKYSPPIKLALIVGSEIGGIDQRLLNLSDVHLQIPMKGTKESFNVAVAGAIALYHLTQSRPLA